MIFLQKKFVDDNALPLHLLETNLHKFVDVFGENLCHLSLVMFSKGLDIDATIKNANSLRSATKRTLIQTLRRSEHALRRVSVSDPSMSR